jgi:NADH pyrophosphatase NudC (nudix superfamily)
MFCPGCGAVCIEINQDGIKREACPKCNYIHYKNPYPCVSVLIFDKARKNKIILGKRSKGSICPEKWCLPCGYIEYDETYEEAAIRETKEEVGITILPKGIINVVSNKFNNGINSLVIVLLAEYDKNEKITPGDDITEAGWFDINDLPPLAFEADNHIINKYKKSGGFNDPATVIPLDGSEFHE